MINLEPRYGGYNCYDQIIESVLRYLDPPEHYPLMFADRFNFRFDTEKSGNRIGERISVNGTNARDLTVEISGISREYKSYDDKKSFLDELKIQSGNGLPLIGHIDSFYSPWDAQYRKAHGPHTLLFLEYDGQTDEILCSDRYYSKKIERFPMSAACAEYLRGYAKVSRRSVKKFDKNDCYGFVAGCLDERLAADANGQFERFTAYLLEGLDLVREVDGYDPPRRCPLITAINAMSYNRDSYCRALIYLRDRYRDYGLDAFIDRVKDAAELWRNAAMTLIKYATKKGSSLDTAKFADTVALIGNTEGDIADGLRSYLSGKHDASLPVKLGDGRREWDADFVAENFIAFDLTPHMSGRAWSTDAQNSIGANYNQNGEFCLTKNPIENATLHYHEAKFPVNIGLHEQPYDYLSCNRQKICLPVGIYSDLLFVGSSQFGAHRDIVKLVYTDGDREVIQHAELGFSDWRGEANLGEHVIYDGFSYKIEPDKNVFQGDCRLFLQRVKPTLNKPLAAIILPYLPETHIFAVGGCLKNNKKD